MTFDNKLITPKNINIVFGILVAYIPFLYLVTYHHYFSPINWLIVCLSTYFLFRYANNQFKYYIPLFFTINTLFILFYSSLIIGHPYLLSLYYILTNPLFTIPISFILIVESIFSSTAPIEDIFNFKFTFDKNFSSLLCYYLIAIPFIFQFQNDGIANLLTIGTSTLLIYCYCRLNGNKSLFIKTFISTNILYLISLLILTNFSSLHPLDVNIVGINIAIILLVFIPIMHLTYKTISQSIVQKYITSPSNLYTKCYFILFEISTLFLFFNHFITTFYKHRFLDDNLTIILLIIQFWILILFYFEQNIILNVFYSLLSLIVNFVIFKTFNNYIYIHYNSFNCYFNFLFPTFILALKFGLLFLFIKFELPSFINYFKSCTIDYRWKSMVFALIFMLLFLTITLFAIYRLFTTIGYI